MDAGEPADVLIVGAGLAGAMLALFLARAGRKVRVFDRDADPRPSFRAEKLDSSQVRALGELGATATLKAAALPNVDPAAPSAALQDRGVHYNAWVRAVRRAWSGGVSFQQGDVARVDTSPTFQSIELRDGQVFSGRLLVIASGRSETIEGLASVSRRIVSANHSVSLGFSVETDRPVSARIVEARPGRKVGYVSVFPMPDEARLNVFTYHAPTDPWLRSFSRDPLGHVLEIAPELAPILGEARVLRKCEVRVTDLTAIENHVRPGVVFIGDAFSTVCPASGTGVSKVLNDVRLLCVRHIPDWLASPGLSRAKIEAFYGDPEKLALDRDAMRRSINARLSTLGASPYWRLRGAAGRLRRRLATAPSRTPVTAN